MLLVLLLFAAMLSPALAAPPDAALQAELLGLYDRYNRALGAGQLDAALALRSREARTRAAQEMKTPRQRAELLDMARSMRPDRVEVVHANLNKAGTAARLVTVASKTMPKLAKPPPGAPPAGTVLRAGVTLSFVKEGSTWKFADQVFGPDPSVRLACADERAEPDSAYDAGRDASVGGPIARVVFNDDHTLVVVRVVDEAACVFLPPRAQLASHGLPPEALVPFAIIEVDGIPHRTDRQKVLARQVRVTDED